MLHVYAAVAEEEARAISKRTKVALAAAKARGVKLGGDRGYRPQTPPDWTLGIPAASAARAQQADHKAHAVLPEIEAIRQDGITSLAGIAAALNEKGVSTPRGGQWTATAVKRALARVEAVDGRQTVPGGSGT
jgi:DNA invertase Pin-like site-specific DNA recombinase